MIAIPQHTTFDIIDHLADDPATLRTCALVSLAWLARSRAHAFHTLTFTRSAQLHAFLALLVPGVHSFRYSVRNLRFAAGAESATPRLVLCAHALATIAGALPTLSALTLEYVNWADTPETQMSGTAALPRLRTLRLFAVGTSTGGPLAPGQLATLLRLFAGVDALDLTWEHDAPLAERVACAKAPALPPLRELALCGVLLNPHFVRWLASSGACDNLQALTIYVTDPITLIALGGLLREHGRTLKLLAVYLHHPGLDAIDQNVLANTLQLANCTSLQLLKFWTIVDSGPSTLSWHWDMGLTMLHALPRRTLRKVEVAVGPGRDLAVGGSALVKSVPWLELQRAMQAFPRLVEVDILNPEVEGGQVAEGDLGLGRMTLRAKNRRGFAPPDVASMLEVV